MTLIIDRLLAMQYNLHKASHSVYAIHLHIYFVTKYRRKFLTAPMIVRIKEVMYNIMQNHKSSILESGAESDHIHLLIDLHPNNNISQLVKSLKSATSQMIQKSLRVKGISRSVLLTQVRDRNRQNR